MPLIFGREGWLLLRWFTSVKLHRHHPYMLYTYLIVFCVIASTFMYAGVFPFGQNSILKMDLLHAYAPDYLEIARKLKTGGSILYSWGGMLGGNLLGSAITVASSPFNLLMFLFPEQYQADFFSLLFLIKAPISAITFYRYSSRKFGCTGWDAVLFSISYALCAYVTAFHFNIMWIDTVIALPIVFLGIDKILDGGGFRLYCGALTYAIFTSFGTAFQVCIFSAVYFLCGILLRGGCGVKSVVRFFGGAILAAGICAVYLFAVVDSFQNSQYLREAVPNVELQFSPLRFIAAHFAGGFSSVRFYSDSVPNIYAGVFAVFLLPLFFAAKQIKFREKLSWGFFLSAVALCFIISTLTYFLHGLHFPVMFPHRYSYIYSFALLVVAMRAYTLREFIQTRSILLTAASLSAVLLLLFLLYPQKDAASIELLATLFPDVGYETGPLVPGRVSLAALGGNILLIWAYACLLWGQNRGDGSRLQKVSRILILAVVCAEAFTGTAYGITNLEGVKHSWYCQELYGDMQEVMEQLNREQQFYRTEFYHYRAQSGGREYGFNGLSGFSVSSGGYPSGLEDLFYELGMSSSFNNLMWNAPSPVMSSVFGQKYLLTEGEIPASSTIFQYQNSYGSVCLYENPYVLPAGFLVPTAVDYLKLSKSGNPITEQSRFFSGLTGQPDTLFELELEQFYTENLQVNDTDRLGEYSYALPDYLSYADIVSGICPRAVFQYAVPKDGYISLTLDCPGASCAILQINGEVAGTESVPWGHTSLNAGFAKRGDILEVILDLNAVPDGGERELIREDKIVIHAALLDMERFSAGIELLKQHPLVIKQYSDTHVSGTVECSNTSLLWTSIPYDHNWHITVDGVETEPMILYNALTGVELSQGTHNLEFSYRMDILPIGAVVSGISFALYMFLCTRVRKKIKIGE